MASSAFKPVTFRPEIEELVRFVEDTDPANMIEATVDKLRSGLDPTVLLTANALAIARSTEVPGQHHGGPIHPVCGIHAVHGISQRLQGELAMLPLIQHTVLCNHHVHSPYMGPYRMSELEPMQGSRKVASGIRAHNVMFEMESLGNNESEAIKATKDVFNKAVVAMEGPIAERFYLWLIGRVSHGELLDLLLPLGISRNNWDDHYYLYPTFTARALDCIGWEWADIMLRPAVRYQARLMPALYIGDPLDFEWVEGLLEEYKLLEIDIPTTSSGAETERIGELGMTLAHYANYFDTIEPIAKALADGLSLEGAGEAISIGAAASYLSTSYGNPMDAHLHTGISNRRYVLRQQGVSLKNKLLGLLTEFTGPEVLLGARKFDWGCNIEPDSTAWLPDRSQDQLLEAIVKSIDGQPLIKWAELVSPANTVPPEGVKETVALARQYAEKGYEPEPYFNRLAEIACRDDYTEMHSLKHFQAIVDEYYTTREPFRWVHLASAAKSAAIIQLGREHSVYRETKELIKA